MNNMITAQNLTKTFDKFTALENLNCSIPNGCIYGMVGSNGAGKSTLLHILGGVDVPSAGKVYIDNVDVYAQDETNLAIFRRRQIGLIYQFYNLIPVLDVEENITLPVLLDGHKVDKGHLKELVETLGLQGRLHHLPNQLSGGQQQRVSIGRALINHPAIVLADEPTGNLDSKNSAEIIALLKMFHRAYQQTLLIITHDERIALQADRVISIEDGRIARDEVKGQ